MISEEARAKMRTLASRYPSARSATLPALRVAQEEEGYVTPAGHSTRWPTRSASSPTRWPRS